MIQFTLKCANDHRFDSWFQSADAYEKLKSANLITCTICGGNGVEKAIMAPRVRASRNTSIDISPENSATVAPQESNTENTGGSLSKPENISQQAISDLKQYVEDNSEYVGDSFIKEARAMQDGDTPARSIYGEAKPEEARALIEDGIKVAPLPFIPVKKVN